MILIINNDTKELIIRRLKSQIFQSLYLSNLTV